MHNADVAQLAARHLAKVKAAGSNPVVRSIPALYERAGPHAPVVKQVNAPGSEPDA